MAAKSSAQATTTAQARALELKALGLGTSATAAEIISAIQKTYGANAPTIDNRTGLPYTPATARAAGSGQAGPQIIGGAVLGGTVGGIIDSLLGAIGTGGTAAAEADVTAGAATDAGATSGGAAGAAGVGAGGLLVATAGGITSTLDFLKFIAWIFHPNTILRAVEFVVGIVLMVFGFHAAMQARGERIEGFSTSQGALSRSGLARVATSLGAAARGSGGGSSGHTPQRPRSAPHRTRQRALSQRYAREEDLQRRRAKSPRPKKSTAKKAETVAKRLVK